VSTPEYHREYSAVPPCGCCSSRSTRWRWPRSAPPTRKPRSPRASRTRRARACGARAPVRARVRLCVRACACALDVHKRGCVLACVRLQQCACGCLVSSRCALVRFRSFARNRTLKEAVVRRACPRVSCSVSAFVRTPVRVIVFVGCVRVRRDGAACLCGCAPARPCEVSTCGRVRDCVCACRCAA
jgi:hypothetical protein